jgi:hypothetical protein
MPWVFHRQNRAANRLAAEKPARARVFAAEFRHRGPSFPPGRSSIETAPRRDQPSKGGQSGPDTPARPLAALAVPARSDGRWRIGLAQAGVERHALGQRVRREIPPVQYAILVVGEDRTACWIGGHRIDAPFAPGGG